jgi:hypothetical protein
VPQISDLSPSLSWVVLWEQLPWVGGGHYTAVGCDCCKGTEKMCLEQHFLHCPVGYWFPNMLLLKRLLWFKKNGCRVQLGMTAAILAITSPQVLCDKVIWQSAGHFVLPLTPGLRYMLLDTGHVRFWERTGISWLAVAHQPLFPP